MSSFGSYQQTYCCVFSAASRLSFQSRQVHPRLPAALLRPAIMCGPATVTATARPALAPLLSRNHPAASETAKPGNQPQSASSSKKPSRAARRVSPPAPVQDGVKTPSVWGRRVQRLQR